ncbi:hypothetical protein HanIR_Chr04g0167511 [Helianthus annuus]|nr:hypothetical protein HanIR_Chr04g0167511 [Helianthus annuus]
MSNTSCSRTERNEFTCFIEKRLRVQIFLICLQYSLYGDQTMSLLSYESFCWPGAEDQIMGFQDFFGHFGRRNNETLDVTKGKGH